MGSQIDWIFISWVETQLTTMEGKDPMLKLRNKKNHRNETPSLSLDVKSSLISDEIDFQKIDHKFIK